MSFDRFMREVSSLPAEATDRSARRPRKRNASARVGDDLYVIVCVETRRCKIGRSAIVWLRLETLQSCSPTQLIIYGHAPGLGFLEDMLHEEFADGRLHGEWFAVRVTEKIARSVRIDDIASFVRFVETIRARCIMESEKRARRLDSTRATFDWRGKRRPR